MAQLPNSKEVGAFQKLYEKNPTAFFGVIFFMMFGITYFLNINSNSDNAQYYKELYQDSERKLQKERDKNDKLTIDLLTKAGVINKQDEIIKKADSTLKDNVGAKVEKILNNENN